MIGSVEMVFVFFIVLSLFGRGFFYELFNKYFYEWWKLDFESLVNELIIELKLENVDCFFKVFVAV